MASKKPTLAETLASMNTLLVQIAQGMQNQSTPKKEKPAKKVVEVESDDDDEVEEDDEFAVDNPKIKSKTDIVFTGNTFTDDMTESLEDIEFTKKIIPKKRKTKPRPKIQFIKRRCATCGKVKKVHPLMAPKIERDDIMFVCDGCVPKG